MVAIQLQQFEVQPGQTLLLRDVDWPEFEAILSELGNHRGTRIAYDHGWLAIMTPLPEHEYLKQSLSIAIEDIAEVLNLDYESYGSATWRQQAQQVGVEPDNCFYVQNAARIRGQLTIDLAQDPPPDLALEIDLTHKSLNRLPIYARLGVPEIWCYDSGRLSIYQLQVGQYVEAEQSQVFPALAIRTLPQLIETYRPQGRLALRRAVRDWVKQQVK
ncbi:Uma2 family endonuclease [Synechococcales cyanobacterium C]|uniref:Uma2 family endonuclease n=1 Tax=Petrachloros mirabilis ULC683 TaxID=2781853 RepID=A0A8K2A1Y6_9CYAN|nr:Uma2 family endonuclease [Petrachloros mirabilis]NCJ08337.1 Uma2 family endonuclease [Petrachloros mirabilis ULC683]